MQGTEAQVQGYTAGRLEQDVNPSRQLTAQSRLSTNKLLCFLGTFPDFFHSLLSLTLEGQLSKL